MTAKRSRTSPIVRAWVQQFGQGLRARGARLFTGDANMMLFCLGDLLAEECSLLVSLIAFHRELGSTTVIPALDQRGLREAMRYDSCGIWLVGGVQMVKVLSPATELEMAALHPAKLEVAQGRFKRYTRGYPLKSYIAPAAEGEAYRRARGVPDDNLVKRLLTIWEMHEVRQQLGHAFAWEVDRPFHAGPFWQEVADCLPRRGEQLEACLFGGQVSKNVNP
jgi:hypothetical protein